MKKQIVSAFFLGFALMSMVAYAGDKSEKTTDPFFQPTQDYCKAQAERNLELKDKKQGLFQDERCVLYGTKEFHERMLYLADKDHVAKCDELNKRQAQEIDGAAESASTEARKVDYDPHCFNLIPEHPSHKLTQDLGELTKSRHHPLYSN